MRVEQWDKEREEEKRKGKLVLGRGVFMGKYEI